ncbi:MAG: hypothetical protein E7656_00580 [Ruminococcaceae bacterium]|nr:hypothetical protein [Oscillospiraceae bacterium]
MDEQLSEKLKSLLSDPDSLKSIMSIAAAFGGAKTVSSEGAQEAAVAGASEEEVQQKQTSDEKFSAGSAEPSINSLQSIPTFSQKGRTGDDRVNLLLSIKPFLSERKRQRVDSIVKALGAAKLISTYKDLDFLTKFGM